MTRLNSRSPSAPASKTDATSPSEQPAGAPASTAKPAAAWGASQATSAADRREKATGVSTKPAELSDSQRAAVVQKKATCPFIGTGVATGALPVRNSADKPLASIDDVVRLGNSGKGSDLGNVLKIFAEGNHAFMPGMSGKLDLPVPAGTLSLDFPGSQGSHAGDSGILQANPKQPNSGRFNDADFQRLLSRAQGGYLKRSDIGRFIGENIARDPQAKAPGLKTSAALVKDLAALAGEVGQAAGDHVSGQGADTRPVYEKLTKLLGEDNLIGSSGEFGLLAAFLANSPNTKQVGGEPAYSVEDVTAMFRDKKFPAGWDTWKKSSADWVTSTAALAASAEAEYLRRSH